MVDRTPSAAPRTTNLESGEIYRRKYTRYSGRRAGRATAYRALIIHSIRRALGIRRKWTSKIIPIILYVSAFLPVIGFISIPAILGSDVISFGPVQLFSGLSLVLLVFAAAASPEMLCDDRRERVLQLYYARGLSRLDYLLAKLIALGILMLTVSLVPALIHFLGNTFLADNPVSRFIDDFGLFLRIIGVSIALSMYFASIGLAVSSVTERKGVASAIYVGIFLAGTAIANGLHQAIEQSWDIVFLLVSPLDIPDGLLLLFLGDADASILVSRFQEDSWLFLLSLGAIGIVAAGLLYRQYLRED